MSQTQIYGAMFYLPMAMIDMPLPFTVFHKGYDELNNDLGYYTYNELYVGGLKGHKAFYTPSGSHFIFSENITSSFIKDDVTTALAGSPFVWVDAQEVSKWQDADQTNYIWCVTTDKRMSYNDTKFRQESALFSIVADEVMR